MSKYKSKATKKLKKLLKHSSQYYKLNNFRFLFNISYLLRKKANPNTRIGKAKMTPLMWAVKNKHLSLVKLLLRNGANPLLKDSKGRTLFNQHYSPKGISQHAAKKIIEKNKKYLFDDMPVPPRPRLRRSGAGRYRPLQQEPRGLLPIRKGVSRPLPQPKPKPKVWKSKSLQEDCNNIRCDYNYLVYADADDAYVLEFNAALAEGQTHEDAEIAAEKIWNETLKKGNKFKPGISVNKFCKGRGCERCGPPKEKGVRYCTKRTYKMKKGGGR